jgi:choline-sulfatase
LTVPQEYWDHYKGKVPLPVIPAGHLESLPRNYKHLRIGFNVEDTPDDVVRKGRELYYGLTEWLDNEVGKVLTALARSAAADNTVVIYTTDHGENMGEHGLWWKNALYEHAAHVPLIVSWPARWQGGRRRAGACSLVDVVQTIAQIGGAKVPADWNGDSMVPWLDNPQTRWKDKAVSEYYAHNIASGYAMIRMGRFKYVYHTPADGAHPAERELYDLEADPGEFHNLANDPSQKDRVQTMHAALVAELGEEPDKTEQRCRADYQRGYERPDQNGKKGQQKQKKKQKQKAAQGL